MSTWFVTGGSGFIGRHVLNDLAEGGSPASRLVALSRGRSGDEANTTYVKGDLEDPSGLVRVVSEVEPDVVIHAAGQVPPADDDRFERINLRGTIHLLRALKATRRPVRVVLVGSAAELGPVDTRFLPVGEHHPCRPRDAYARSKWFATCAGLMVRPPLEVIVARVFNPIGPGMPVALAFGRFASMLAATSSDPVHLSVGDLEARRDFVDVRDVSRALIALARKGRSGLLYNVATGHSHRVRDGLDRLVALSGRRVEIEEVPSSGRGPLDSRADIRRITRHTGWTPRYIWEQSLADLWDDARDRSSSSVADASKQVA